LGTSHRKISCSGKTSRSGFAFVFRLVWQPSEIFNLINRDSNLSSIRMCRQTMSEQTMLDVQARKSNASKRESNDAELESERKKRMMLEEASGAKCTLKYG